METNFSEFKAQVENWMDFCEKFYTIDTNRSYKSILFQLLKYISEQEYEKRKFNAEIVEKWLSYKLETGGSRRMWNSYLTCVRSFVNWRRRKYGLESDELGSESDIHKIPKLRVGRKMPRFLSEDEFQYALDCCENTIDRHILIFLSHTGIRKEEFRQLKWKDIDENLRFIRITNGKGRKSRLIPLNVTCREILDDYPRLADECSLQLAARYRGHEGSSYLCRRISDNNNMKRFGSHSLRRLLASRLMRKNVNIYKISKILGHTSIKTTEIYLHLDNSDIMDCLDCLD